MPTYDVIVLGTGGVGSAAAYHLARRGLRVLGLDRFSGGHDRGSSHGQTRIIRKAYFEHSNYVPLLQRAYELWFELEQFRKEKLYQPVGLVQIGPPDGVVIRGVLESAARHGLPIEQWDHEACSRFIPGFTIPEGYSAVFERQAGYLHVERCVLAHLQEAQHAGAELRCHESVISWRDQGDGVEVRTDLDTYSAGKLVIAAGAWASQILGGLSIRLSVLRKHLHWFRCHEKPYQQQHGCPTFLYDLPEGCFYGFPCFDETGLKVAEHSGGTAVADPLDDARLPEPEDEMRVESFVDTYLPGVSLVKLHHCVCYYTLSPDRHFIVDKHPENSAVVFAAGLSGHGFKFTSVLGEALADLAENGTSQLPIKFLGLERFGR